MKTTVLSLTMSVVVLLLFSFAPSKANEELFTLTIKVDGFRTSTGVAQYSIYNKDGTIPDEHFERYYLQKTGEITKNHSVLTFINIPRGRYAVNILHDENENGKIDKGWVMPIEGIGFSNYSSIGLTNRPKFSKASFDVNSNMTITVKIIYL